MVFSQLGGAKLPQEACNPLWGYYIRSLARLEWNPLQLVQICHFSPNEFVDIAFPRIEVRVGMADLSVIRVAI